MTTAEVMTTLTGLRDESTFKQNTKRGVGEDQIGVKMGDLRNLAKKIKTDHELGLQLWDHGQHEAMLLAILILSPKKLDENDVDRMAREIRDSHVADWFSSYLLKGHSCCTALCPKWIEDPGLFMQRLGWGLLARMVGKDEALADPVALMTRIEAEMGSQPEVVQWTMNYCLVEVGIQYPQHRDQVISIAEKIGAFRNYPVSKGCVSPFAPIWIDYMVKRGN